MKNELKLYVWEDALSDYSEGVMFSLAKNLKEARALLVKKGVPKDQPDLKRKPKIFSKKSVAFYIYGGS